MEVVVGGSLNPKGPAAADIADLWWLMLWLGVATFALFLFLLVRGLLRKTDDGEPDRSRSFLVGGGLFLPAVVVSVVFGFTLTAMQALSTEPADDALTIRITGHQWWWEIEYPEHGIRTANEFHIPVGRDVALELTSGDVVHSFWIPALAGKLDLLPESVNTLVIRADEPGNYGGLCAEFCGLQHTKMAITAIAESEEGFDTWLSVQAEPADSPRGRAGQEGLDIFLQAGCSECHSIRGTEANGDEGPDLTHLATRMSLGAGTLTNNPTNLADWITRPQAHKEGISMESPELSEEDLELLARFLGTLE